MICKTVSIINYYNNRKNLKPMNAYNSLQVFNKSLKLFQILLHLIKSISL